jgi:hypothetical protein
MLKKYSIAIPLNNEAYNYAKKIQQKLYDDSAINSILLNNSDPHINIISGSTNNIENIINIARECPFSQPNFTKFFGIGILLTPDPLIFMRFTNSIFLRELKKYLHSQTLPFWDKLSSSVDNDIWLPKCTLAYRDFSLNELSEALLCLEGMNFSCRMEITELSIIDFTENEREVIRFNI